MTPPAPVYGPSVPSRTTTMSMVSGDPFASGDSHSGVQPDRPQVDVVVKLEAQPEQQPALEDPARHRRVADAPSRIASCPRISSSTVSGSVSPVRCQRRAPRS